MTTLQTQKLLIEGYLREAHKVLKNDQIIPMSLAVICYEYLSLRYGWYYSGKSFWISYNPTQQDLLDNAWKCKDKQCKFEDGDEQRLVTFETDKYFSKTVKGTQIDGDIKDDKDSIKVIRGSCDDYGAVVIDNGSSSIKVGFAGYDMPLTEIPTVIGRTKYDSNVDKTYEIGLNALKQTDKFQLRYPIKNGVINNWHDMV